MFARAFRLLRCFSPASRLKARLDPDDVPEVIVQAQLERGIAKDLRVVRDFVTIIIVTLHYYTIFVASRGGIYHEKENVYGESSRANGFQKEYNNVVINSIKV